jgi:hypothetical protein
MTYESNTSMVPSVVREFAVLLLVVMFASTPFFAAQAREVPAATVAATNAGN